MNTTIAYRTIEARTQACVRLYPLARASGIPDRPTSVPPRIWNRKSNRSPRPRIQRRRVGSVSAMGEARKRLRAQEPGGVQQRRPDMDEREDGPYQPHRPIVVAA
jgi:hypothetical protein